MFLTIKKLFLLLTPEERKRLILLLIIVIVMAFLEMIGVASILPFIAVLSNPEVIQTNFFLNKVFKISLNAGVNNEVEFLYLLGLLVFFLLIFSLIFKSFTIYFHLRFIKFTEYRLSKRLIEIYLKQPYSWFLNQNSNELGKNILSEVNLVINGGLSKSLRMISSIFVSLALIILLIFTDPVLAVSIGFSLSLIYILIYQFTKKYLNKIGEDRFKNNELRFKIINELFSAIKIIKLGAFEKIYIKKYSSPGKSYAEHMAASEIVGQLPRYILEAIAFGGIMLSMIYLLKKSGNFNSALPVISLYVFAGYRIMPALQQIYASVSYLRFIGPALDKLYKDMFELMSVPQYRNENNLIFKSSLSLKNISYRYAESTMKSLNNININIDAKNTVGIIGSTGSGKTTIVNIILGLLFPEKGCLYVDGKKLSRNYIKIWQKFIGYVPQNIYLSDDTVASNIAFGVDRKNINQFAVEKASKIANIHNFITHELPKQYDTKIGENGVKLSGGQRQRIAIARALYHNPKLLILDEATSALDNNTEKAVMDAVNNLRKDITIIIVAHRYATIKSCDIIYEIKNGSVVKKGNYNELELTNTKENELELTNTKE